MRSSHGSVRWYVPDPEDLVWASWGDAYVAYHRPSGKTHFLNSASYLLLAELLQEPLDVDAIVRELGPEESGDDATSEQNRQQFAGLLKQLEQLGLVRTA